jgi:hypothetical protein
MLIVIRFILYLNTPLNSKYQNKRLEIPYEKRLYRKHLENIQNTYRKYHHTDIIQKMYRICIKNILNYVTSH